MGNVNRGERAAVGRGGLCKFDGPMSFWSMRGTRRTLAAVFFLLLSGLAAKTYTAEVIRVTDGDTVVVRDAAGAEHKIRLAGIDAPEKRQEGGPQSLQNLSRLVLGKTVSVDVQGLDRYQRQIAVLSVGGVNVNHRQVRDGMAWQYLRYDKSPVLAELEKEARSAQRGLWAGENPQPPWEYRGKGRRPSKPRRQREAVAGEVKKSRSGICHTPESSSYSRTTNFIAYPKLEDCLADGGRLPKG